MRAGIYMGWIGFRNLGDEAMYAVCKQRFRSVRWCNYDYLAYTPNISRSVRSGPYDFGHLLRLSKEEILSQPRLRRIAVQRIHEMTVRLGTEVGLLGGGTLINQTADDLKAYVNVRKRTGSVVPTFGTGVASPNFWSAKSGWKDRRSEWVSVLEELPIVGVRGPLSKNLLDDAGARNVVVSGDPAVAYHSEFVERRLPVAEGHPIRVAINTGYCAGDVWGSLEEVQEALIGLVRWLQTAKCLVELIPVWPEDFLVCVDIAKRAGLPKSTVLPVLDSPVSFLKRVVKCDIVVALKLHAGILSAAANVPFILLEYQPKCLDFATSLGWERFTIRTNELTTAALISRVSLLIHELPIAREQLCRSMCQLSRQFEEYCLAIGPLVSGNI